MGLFGKIRGEFVDIIEWLDNSNDTIAYRFERFQNEIKQGAKLTVRPGQVAVFVNEGQVADVFDPGLYELYTRNLPILTTLKGWPYGFNSPFKAEVYFFNTRIFTNLKWGTANPFIIRDPELGPVRVRAYGTYSMRVADADHFLQTLIGTDGLFQVDEISDQIRNIIVSAFSNWVGNSQIPLLDFAANYTQMGEQVRQGILPQIQQLGLNLTQLLIENISLPPEVESALDKRASMGLIGNMQQFSQYQAAKSIEASANNPGGGNSALDFGVGMAMGQQLSNTMQSPQTPAPPSAPPPLSQPQWYLAQNGQQVGPFTVAQLPQQGLTGETMVWRAGLAEWVRASQVPELSNLMPPPPPPPPPSAPSTPSVPSAGAGVSSGVAEWYIFRSGDAVGPFTLAQLRTEGISSRTNIRREGETEWTRARDIPQLQSILEE